MSIPRSSLFVIAPLVELASIVLVAQRIGWWTVPCWSAPRARRVRDPPHPGRAGSGGSRQGSAGSAAGDSAMLFVAGLLLLIPGFMTDVLGLLLLLPLVRVLLRRRRRGTGSCAASRR